MGSSQAGGSSATIEPNEALVLGSARSRGWRESILVLAMVLAPVGLAIVLVITSIFVIAGWQIVRGVPAHIPARADLQLYGLLSYIIASWVAVAAVWLWTSRGGLRREVFKCHRLTWPTVTASIMGFLMAMYGAPVMTHWLSQATGGRGPGVQINYHDGQSVAMYALLFVVTAPVCEEILYRGLLVAWLRRIGWRNSGIWLVGSLIFGANHWIPLGFVWSAVMVVFGGLLFAMRLRYDSLSPGWLVHFLFNAQPFLAYPLISSVSPALLPGSLS
ncbi:CPBP family intramembrane metalloprotease [Bradyrhizobium sp. 179]|uniref:CPBP family intramembrane glutamic endopeptidase n=1 Tax=Bradyrhizobium sp. 179 TaxID=2782648 RepID=UPI001FF99663|nr:type II CAAX endopeptidase family protein [Bradyrhizobium sp. 179]MCK1544819.1 CPBP family intramembrane metalloprotease [Bradyrhizobium sp. 179]